MSSFLKDIGIPKKVLHNFGFALSTCRTVVCTV